VHQLWHVHGALSARPRADARRLFRYALLGDREEVLGHTETIFSCLLCRMCEANCPAGVHIAENVRTLRTYLNREVHGLAEA